MRCSREHLKEYENAIHAYLQSKNIIDFSKFEISFKEGKLFFDKWEYEDIQKPVSISPIPKTLNYYDLYTRKIIVNITENEENKHVYLNVDGDRVTSNYIDQQNRHIQKIIESYEKVGGQWNTIAGGSGSNLYLTNGVIVINNHIGQRFRGTLHIVIIWYKIEDTVGQGLQSVNKTNTVNTLYYTFPKNY